ncbi:MAG: sulfatase-like hydrolase/transferase, partial [Glycocaulis sp.]
MFAVKTVFFSFIAMVLLLTAPVTTARSEEIASRPNILILLVDDAAFMDFGVYGGEARTPNIDALAARGAMFTGFRTSPLCAPSRAMLLTGMDNHQTGVATIPEVLTPEQKGQPGYAMALEPGVETLATRLKPAGYRTLMTGKWHLGSGPGDLPSDHSFDRSFALDASGADNWEDKSYMPYYREAPWYEDGQPAQLPEDFYSSDFIVDKMIEYLDATPGEAPFLALLGFLAVHIPVQAPAHLTAGYDGIYDAGWDALRTARWERAQELGL